MSKKYYIVKLLIYFFLGFCLYPEESSANEIYSTCPSNGDLSSVARTTNDSSVGICHTTPEVYKIKVYEMGLCTSDPLENNNFDSSSCVSSYKTSSPSYIDLASLQSLELLENEIITRPPNNSYTHAFVIGSNSMRIKGSYDTGTQNRCTQWYLDPSTGNYRATTQECQYLDNQLSQEYEETLDTFTSDECDPTYLSTINGIEIKARFTNDLGETTNAVSYPLETGENCGSPSRLVASYKAVDPILITDSTNGLEVTFKVKNYGLVIVTDNDVTHNYENIPADYYQNQASRIVPGGFYPTFKTF